MGRWLVRGLCLGLLAFVVFGPLANMVLWAFTERWYFPHALPIEYGFSFWGRVFAPRGGAIESLVNSAVIAVGTVAMSLALAVPAGYALARLRLPFRSLILLAFLLPQAFPNLPVYINIARIFYGFGLNGTYLGVVLVHTSHGLVYAVWIATAAFASVEHELEEAARNIGAGAMHTFWTITLPLAAPGIMAAGLLGFILSWNEFLLALILSGRATQTLPVGLSSLETHRGVEIALLAAAALLAILPVFVLLPFLRKYLIKGLSLGALK